MIINIDRITDEAPVVEYTTINLSF